MPYYVEAHYNGDKKKLKAFFSNHQYHPNRDQEKSVKEAKRYILGNWNGIRNQYESDYEGCSAEGHVSHILSSRLSSRPLAWCKIGVDQMARLRAFAANGGVVYDLLMEKKRAAQKEARILKIDQEVTGNRKVVGLYETLDNITILNIGKNYNLTFSKVNS